MAEQRYLYGDPCFKVRQREGVRRWLCETCGGPRDEHLVLIVEDRADDWRRPDRVIAMCPDGRVNGPVHLLYNAQMSLASAGLGERHEVPAGSA